MITNNFNYVGKVSIEVTRNGHPIRRSYTNSGTSALFKMFAYALTGNDVSNMAPAYFALSKDGDSVNLPIIKIYYPQVAYSGSSPYIENVCRLQCNLPLFKIGHMKPTEGTANETYSLNILSYEEEKLAEITISGDSFNGLKDSDQVIIIWDLYVTNPPQNKEEGE